MAAVALVKPNGQRLWEHRRDPSDPLPSPWSMASSQEAEVRRKFRPHTRWGFETDTPMQDLEARDNIVGPEARFGTFCIPPADSAKAAFGFVAAVTETPVPHPELQSIER